MKSHRRALALLLSVTTVLSSWTTPVHADETFDYDAAYSAIVNTGAGAYMLQCQPDTALHLPSNEGTLTLTVDMLSRNYDEGYLIFDLPRLDDNYYYDIDQVSDGSEGTIEISGKGMIPTVYPVLRACHAGTVNLYIKSFNGDTTSYTCKITIPDYDENDPNNLLAKKFKETDEHDALKDVSADLINSLTSGATEYIPNDSGCIQLYPAEWNKSAVITDKYAVGNLGLNTDSNSTAQKISAILARPDHGNMSSTPKHLVTKNVKYVQSGNEEAVPNTQFCVATTSTDHAKFMSYLTQPFRSKTKNALLFYGASSEVDASGYNYFISSYDNNKHTATTKLKLDASKNVVGTYNYFVATSDNCWLYTLDKAVSKNDNSLMDTSQNSNTETPKHELMMGKGDTANLVNVNAGPLNFDVFKEVNSTIKWTQGESSTEIGFSEATFTNADSFSLNVIGTTLLFNGVLHTNVGQLTLKKPVPQLTIKYMVQKPDEVTYTQYPNADTVYTFDTKGDDKDKVFDYNRDLYDYEKLGIKAIENYAPDCWYVYNAEGNLVPTNISMFSVSEDTTIVLYGKFKDVHPTYTFYTTNDGTTYTSTVYKTTEMPIIPDPPKSPTAGITFKRWMLASNRYGADGQQWDANAFKPQKGGEYYLVPEWDNSGTILRVETSKTSYFVGDSIDKNTLDVYVTDGSATKERKLAPNEFTIAPDKVTSVGDNKFTVTVTAVGTQAVCTVQGVEVIPKSIKAEYVGETKPVGSDLKTSDFKVTMTYNNGKSEEIKDFIMSPVNLLKIGSNSITVKSRNLSYVLDVTAIAKSNNSQSNPSTDSTKTLSSIKASYVGGEKFIYNFLYGTDFKVVATYSDGTKSTLSSDAFTYNPTQLTKSGITRVTIKYRDKQNVVNVTAKAINNNNNGGDDSDWTPSVKPSGTPTSSPYPNSTDPNSTSSPNGTATSSPSPKPSATPSATPSAKPKDGNDSKKDDDEEEHASPYYLGGATIDKNQSMLGAQVGDGSEQVNTVDILKTIKDTSASSSVITIKLTNGAKGNDITAEMMNEVRKKTMTLEVHMIDYQTGLEVARWTIKPETDENKSQTFDPNVDFVIRDFETCRSVLINLSPTTIPSTASLTISPLSHYFNISDPVRLYTCNAMGEDAHLVNTISWADSTTFSLDTQYRYWCLSDSPMVYTDGSSILVDNNLSDTVSGNAIDIDANGTNTDTEETEDQSTEESASSTDFDWGDEESTSNDTPKKSKLPFIIIGVVATVALASGGVGAFILLSKKSPKAPEEFDEPIPNYSDEDSPDDYGPLPDSEEDTDDTE